jgi:hypothetical protein
MPGSPVFAMPTKKAHIAPSTHWPIVSGGNRGYFSSL